METKAMNNRQAKGTQILDQMLGDGSPAFIIFRAFKVIFFLYCFLVGVKLLSTGIKMLGADFANTLFTVTSNPFLGLLGGVLATTLFQSSSVTTSILVGMVSSGALSVSGAVPMIMGANIGTSVTNTLVSLGHIRDQKHFKTAFAAATVHDFFNILAVIVFLPIEIMTGVFEKSAHYLADVMYGSFSGVTYSSPIKAMIKPPVKFAKGLVVDYFGEGSTLAAIALGILAAITIIMALTLIVKTMKAFIKENEGSIIESFLSKNVWVSIFFGIVITITVQSSSITTSLLVPLAGAGVIGLPAIFPVTVGANIGTTATAMLAALTGNAHGLTLALVHLLFNIGATLLFFAPKRMRAIPMGLAMKLGAAVDKNKSFALLYIGVVFFLVPFILIGIWK